MSDSRHSDFVSPFDAVVAVGSQGALQAVQAMLGSLPPRFPAAIILDLHRAPGQRFTEQLLARRAALAVKAVVHGMALEPATVHLAPWDRPLVLTEESRLAFARQRGSDPWARGADGLLASAAAVLGPRVIAVVLSGRLDGGTRGVREIKRHGGRVLVQDPSTASAPSMPNGALATGCADFALPPEGLGRALVALCASAGAAELFRVRLNAGVRG